MHELPFFFPRDREKLYGILHRPAEPRSNTGFVLCHPLAEEKLWSHRVFVSIARTLAARGHAVLRFDFTGAGDSSGWTADSSLDTHVADLAAAVREIAAREPALERIGLIGLRLGASVAALLAEHPTVELPAALRTGPLVLWDPVLDGAAYLQDIMRTNLSGQLASFGKVIETREAMQARIESGGCVDIDGYELAKALFESCNQPALLAATPKRHAGRALLVHVAPARRQKPRPDLDALAASYGRGEVVTVDEQPFWREVKEFYGRANRLEAATLEWLGRGDV